jgi:RNA 2',3'-cyclic 3'-phosphodiesterase
MRCFLAVPLAAPALGEAQRLQATLRERVADVRWARPETLHITVHFFGEIAAAQAAEAIDAVRPVAQSTRAFDIELHPLGAFPPRGSPRVLWLGPAHDIPALTAFAGACATALRDAGFEVESRPYRAHCTLGRPRLPMSDAARTAWAASVAEPRATLRFTARRLVLFESRSMPGGAVYTEVAVVGLAPA